MAAQAYLREGIRRIETGEVQAGSHAAGIFGRCAKEFESAMRVWFTLLLQSCGLEYEKDIKIHCKGVALNKTTLGNLITGIEQAVVQNPECVGCAIPSVNDVPSFVGRLREINVDWVRMKHREEVGIPVILERMKSIAGILEILAVEPQSKGDA